MKEYDFIRIKNQIYRIFGRVHPLSHYLVLLRYYKEKGAWIKPPKYGADEKNPESIAHYGCPMFSSDMYQIPIGIIKPTEIDQVIDPCEPFGHGRQGESLLDDISSFLINKCDIQKRNIGMIGSALIGLQKPSSDLDLVIYGIQSASEVVLKFKEISEILKQPLPENSVMVNRFLSSFEGQIKPCNNERFIYSGIFKNKKVDFHFALKPEDEAYKPMPAIKTIQSSIFLKAVVQNSEKRHFYPGTIEIDVLNREFKRKYAAVIMDHAMHFLLAGDEIEFEASLCQQQSHDFPNIHDSDEFLVCTKLIRIKPKIN